MKYLLLGYGSIGKRHSSIIKQFDDKATIVYSTRRRPDEISGEWIARADINQLDADFDLGIIATPTCSHLEDIIAVTSLCTKVLVEKPLLSFNISEAAVECLKSIPNKDNIYVGYNMKHYSIVQEIIRCVKRNIKQDKYFDYSSHCFSHIARWRGSLNKSRVSICKQLEGGIVNELSHELDILAASTSYKCSGNIRIEEQMTRLIDDVEDVKELAPDRAHIAVNSDAFSARINLSFSSHYNSRQIVIEDKNKTIVFDLLTGKEEHFIYDEKKYSIQHEHNRDLTFLNQLRKIMRDADDPYLTTLNQALKLLEWTKRST